MKLTVRQAETLRKIMKYQMRIEYYTGCAHPYWYGRNLNAHILTALRKKKCLKHRGTIDCKYYYEISPLGVTALREYEEKGKKDA